MNYKEEDAILRAWEKIRPNDIINILVKTDRPRLMYAVFIMDGKGMPKEQLTAWHSNPGRLIDTARANTPKQ